MKDASLARTQELSARVLDEVQKAIVGKREALEMILLGILSGGHILVEDFPGLAKTLIALCFAKTLGIDFNRIQFTPDLLPGDITGGFIYDQREGRFEFRKGALFTNLLLGDEINRAPPKTQAALLEAMQEHQVTVEGTTYDLESPFIVIATQNPIEYEGTYPLPEAQLDRFMLRVGIGYPTPDEEWEILSRRIERRQDDVLLNQIVDGPGLLEMQASLERVYLSDEVGRYIVDLVSATRADPDVQVGASPRGALSVMKLSRAKALLGGRDFVTPDDVKTVTVAALSHRLTLRPELWVRRVTGEQVVQRLVDRVPTPATEGETAAG
ncbi:MAG: MoxR-like ATPase [Actinomycetota bacterium]|nr:MoxR-like ATPase [Actinomycetota bacterium]